MNKNGSLGEECNGLSLPHATLTRVPALHCCSCNIIITINNISNKGKNRIFSRMLFFSAHVELVTVLVVVLVFEILSARCSFFFYYNIVLLCFLHSINFACKLTTFHKSVAFLCWFLNSTKGRAARPTYSCSSLIWSQIWCCCNLYKGWGWHGLPPTNNIASDLACFLICTRISKVLEVRLIARLSLQI